MEDNKNQAKYTEHIRIGTFCEKCRQPMCICGKAKQENHVPHTPMEGKELESLHKAIKKGQSGEPTSLHDDKQEKRTVEEVLSLYTKRRNPGLEFLPILKKSVLLAMEEYALQSSKREQEWPTEEIKKLIKCVCHQIEMKGYNHENGARQIIEIIERRSVKQEREWPSEEDIENAVYSFCSKPHYRIEEIAYRAAITWLQSYHKPSGRENG
jgi:hypothetical protein